MATPPQASPAATASVVPYAELEQDRGARRCEAPGDRPVCYPPEKGPARRPVAEDGQCLAGSPAAEAFETDDPAHPGASPGGKCLLDVARDLTHEVSLAPSEAAPPPGGSPSERIPQAPRLCEEGPRLPDERPDLIAGDRGVVEGGPLEQADHPRPEPVAGGSQPGDGALGAQVEPVVAGRAAREGGR